MRKRFLATAGLLLLGSPLLAATIEDKACLECHAEAGMEATFTDGTKVPLTVDQDRFRRSAHGAKQVQCVACHHDISLDTHPNRTLTDHKSYSKEMTARCAPCHTEIANAFADGIHHRSPMGPIGCVECHDPHYMTHAHRPRATISQTCAKCHPDINAKYGRSIHGSALLGQDNPDVPVCTDCHQAHANRRVASMQFRMDIVDHCASCHTDAKKMEKYGISTAVLQTYLQDFHGVSVKYERLAGGVRKPGPLKATCVDCHGAHDIDPKGSRTSLAVRANATKACAKCHEGATDSFTASWLGHHPPSLIKTPLVFLIRLAYLIFIPIVVCGLVVHVIMDLRYLRRLKRHQVAPKPHAAGPVKWYVRFNPFRRFEHLLAAGAIVVLFITGMPQKYHETAWGAQVILTLGGMDSVQFIHRVAGAIFAIQGVVHMAVNLLGLLTGRMHADMIVTRKDYTDTFMCVKNLLGLSDVTPKCDRYDFRQKFEYWGMLIGGVLMIATGFILIFPALFARFLPGELIPAAKTAHSYEALMALLVVMVWHFYCAVLRADIFPMDTSIFTGKISQHRMEEEHPLELERIEASEHALAATGSAKPPTGAAAPKS